MLENPNVTEKSVSSSERRRQPAIPVGEVPLPIRIDKDFAPTWDESIPIEDYHADKTTVSSTTLKTILRSSAAFRERFLAPPSEPTPAMALGTLVHHAILEGVDFLKKYVVVPDFGDLRSSKNREKRDEWKAEQPSHSIFVTQQQRDQIKGMVESVYSHPDACSLLGKGVNEISGYYADPGTGIVCRIRPDCVDFRTSANVDIKTTDDCSLEAFQRSIVNFGYDFQMAMYCDGIRVISGKRVEFPAWIVPETKKPYETAVYVADDEIMSRGLTLYHEALERLSQCLKRNEWPPRQLSAETITLPSWALTIQ